MNVEVMLCVLAGLFAGVAIGKATEYFTSFDFGPVINLNQAGFAERSLHSYQVNFNPQSYHRKFTPKYKLSVSANHAKIHTHFAYSNAYPNLVWLRNSILVSVIFAQDLPSSSFVFEDCPDRR